jgi:endonuclease/exonuclease/phosphatase family metal-dependent hydrolase
MPFEFTVMTYNVHSCIGMDGKVSPLRIADVIAQADPDIIALQELDVGLARTVRTDQAHLIAQKLEMQFHFHPSLRIESGEYGNATLSRFPMHLVQGGELPTFPHHRRFERRGALWAEVRISERKLQVINAHLGLHRQERSMQTDFLLGPQWLGHPECKPPVILCGDLNTLPWSSAPRRFRQTFVDAHLALGKGRFRGTWPSFFPVARIDYVFVSPEVRVIDVRVLRTPTARIASDHLPLVARLQIR